MIHGLQAALAVLFLASIATAAPARPHLAREQSIAELARDLDAQSTTSERLVAAFLARIKAIDQTGPELNSVLALNPSARADARARDAERKAGRVRGPLHGIPILVKDNIETADPLATTAGSLALRDNITGRDAPLVARLRAAGAIVLGKTNLSEWANIRSSRSVSGWSAMGGFTKNPYFLDRNPCGSSSGSGAAAAAYLAAAAIGTETDGSIICPASVSGLVGLKPTVGLVSRTNIVPISHNQDTAGPMARSVADAAVLLTVMAGTDAADAATKDADMYKSDYTKALDAGALAGKRVGVLNFLKGYHEGTDVAFARAIETMKQAGATIVEIEKFDGLDQIGKDEFSILLHDLKVDLNAYLGTLPPSVKTRTLADVIAFNERTPAELAYFGQDLFVQAEKTSGTNGESDIELAVKTKRAAADGIDRMLADNNLDALVAPTGSPAWTTDVVNGDHFLGSATTLPAVAGYPHITVPMGEARGLPLGISFFGTAWSEAKLIALAYAFEQRTKARKPPKYMRTIEVK
jgi:amidase